MISDSGSDYYSKTIKFTEKDNQLAVYFKNGFEVLDSYVAIETADQVILVEPSVCMSMSLVLRPIIFILMVTIFMLKMIVCIRGMEIATIFTYAGKGGTSINTTINVKSTIYPTYRTGNGWRFDQYEIFAIPGIYTGVSGTQPTVVVDYAHTPDALQQTLHALRKHTQGKLWCVFGCGGDRDQGKRPLMGKIAEELAEQVILTNDNPRHENPQIILQEFSQAFTILPQFR